MFYQNVVDEFDKVLSLECFHMKTPSLCYKHGTIERFYNIKVYLDECLGFVLEYLHRLQVLTT
jgi:hypothetical protein